MKELTSTKDNNKEGKGADSLLSYLGILNRDTVYLRFIDKDELIHIDNSELLDIQRHYSEGYTDIETTGCDYGTKVLLYGTNHSNVMDKLPGGNDMFKETMKAIEEINKELSNAEVGINSKEEVESVKAAYVQLGDYIVFVIDGLEDIVFRTPVVTRPNSSISLKCSL